ncbi:UDP-N-acetylmuramate--L-alanine ligase [Acetivibrio ethanolgignens]|uniref:UDP-N-acetylmuramate--L-alanine ligase n=1 Tax=Acetivibrio ethanolgignens TaxID=290052 RepID=A0A0V8QBT8_9FIRM|nr:UDP-N-acetylmuramate--L-alanine ligase [Acetivibrio ethanolgignens]KSV58061.1 UDP-N-acetylmuramate--alanine ligase [Acetivibrio ethanolgignens]
MYKIDFTHPCHVHFIGIGGISMSGFAELLHSAGFTVSGSDNTESLITEHLEELGIRIVYEQAAANITPDIDFVVYTAAIHPNNPEFSKAMADGIPMLERAEMVGQIMKNYETAIAVAGTHGKTTTTSMLSHILLAGDLDPTISVGGILKALHGNIRIGKSGNFLTEACEYTNSFLKFNPTMGVILNIEAEHLDFFKDLNDIRHSFLQFAHLLPENGVLVINGDIENYTEITKGLACPYLTYSLADSTCNLFAANISYDENGHGSFDVIYNGAELGRVALHVVGTHNISNALAAIGIALSLHIDMEHIKEGLATFGGTDRRFQYKGDLKGITVIDDYAHHPTEIKATLTAAKRLNKPVWCVFQPHTYSRTKAFLKDFAQALSLADKIVLADIYSAREVDTDEISSRDLQKELQDLGKNVWYFPSFDEIEDFLLENCSNGDLLITMGAGNIVSVGEDLLGL